MFMRNDHRYLRQFFQRFPVCFLIFLIWHLPFLKILIEIVTPSQTSIQITGSGLLSTPPPWLKPELLEYRWLELCWRSLRLGSTTAFLAIPASILIAFCLSRCHWNGYKIVAKIWQLLIFVPLPISATIWLGSFSNLGRAQAFGISARPLLSGWWAASVVHAIALMPLLVWIFTAVFQRSSSELEELARLDSRFPRSFFRSTLRQSLPAILASAIIVLLQTAGDMTVTDLVQERTFAEESYLQAQMGDGLSAAAKTAIPPTVFISILIMIWMKIYRHRLLSMNSIPKNSSKLHFYYKSTKAFPAAIFCVLTTLLFWALPIMAISWRAGRSGGLAVIEKLPTWQLKNLINNLANAREDLLDTLPDTALVCTSTALIAVIMAWLMAESAVRSRLIARCLICGCILGLATPGPVAGLSISWVWMPIQPIYDGPAIVILAQLFRLLPVAVFWIWPGVAFRTKAFNDLTRLEQLSIPKKIKRVILPDSAPLLTATFFIIFAMSFAELPASNIVAPPGLELFSIRLWGLMHTGLESHLSAVVLLSLLLIGFVGILFSVITAKLVNIFENNRYLMK
jgi:iron(III) transport system permease protein